MDPFAVAPGFDNPGTSQVRKMPGYFRLTLLQNFHKVANAHLATIHQIQQA
jgi:hypothetical protein